ncbi:hypothetical protein CDL15_Pgr016810 [Punica granatum]|uniref:Uncharacterized protein n=1 Tax=Punica granatum TaxID=22663 RepID=A0A218WXN9_PUNGR|nr:hypothetical protein CDL15_Pgr016810 [Punica granatum]PKI36365.1 hypothetical protein CRG98_043249 [Punica granatum]
MDHGRLEVGPLCMLALSLVRILVFSQCLRGEEVSTAVMALELTPALSILGVVDILTSLLEYMFSTVVWSGSLEALGATLSVPNSIPNSLILFSLTGARRMKGS